MIRLLFLLFPVLLFSQFKVTHYTSENGLPHDLCYQIIQDKQGFIWLGTDNGLVKFNGSTFQNYNRNQGLTNSFVIDVFENENEKLVATWGGGCYVFNGKEFKSIGLEKSNFSKQQQIVRNKDVIYSIENRSRINSYNTKTKISQFYSLVYNEGKLVWWSSDKNANKLLTKLNPNTIGCNLQIERIDASVYCYTDKNSPQFKGIVKLNENFKTENPFPFLNTYNIIGLQKKRNHFLAVTPNKIIEFNTKGILSIQNKNFEDKTILQFSENNSFRVFLLQNKKENNHEIIIEDKTTKRIITIVASSLKSPISDILISNDNSIWVSTYGNGLFIIQKPVIQVAKNILQGNYVFDYLEKIKNNFFLSENTLIINNKEKNLYTKHSIETVSHFRNRANDTVFVFTKNTKNYSFKIHNQYIKSSNLKNQIVVNNQKFEQGDNELVYLENGEWKNFQFIISDEEKLFFKIKDVLFYKNEYWVFTNLGIFVYNKNYKQIKHYTSKNGLLQNEIIKAVVYQNKLYVLNYLGFSVFEKRIFKNFKYNNNDNDTFNDFVISPNGNLWIACQKGLIEFKDNLFLKFTRNEGLSSSFYSKIFINSKNELVALGNNGVDFINAYFQPNVSLPNLVITNKNSKKPILTNTIIKYQENFVIKAEVVGFQNSKPILEYNLNNQKWVKLNTFYFDFTNFTADNYQIQFRVKYPFTNYVYSRLYFIKKEPVWYMRWFVFLPAFLFLLSGIGVLVYLRIQQLNKRNKNLKKLLDSNEKLEFQLNEMRHNIAQDFHDELGNKLAGISVLSDKLLHDENLKTNQNYATIERINKDSQDLFQGIRDFIWAIDSKNGTLEELIFTLTDFGEELFQNSGINFFVENNITEAKFLLPNFWNRQLLLLFKEAMTNAFKHSHATSLYLIFRINDTNLTIECLDNGVGFITEKLQRKNGLHNLKKRADKLKSQLIINSNSGTSVKFIGEIN
ncbi:hypothetical protein EQG63_04450 [Flavobacterium amnicola]|uniref:Signal transduction histidine kinase subgroup 3 dimerisation and phosphoacceptor domain-containing protein n=1 Tax=Flavobacterium amnicola TaxID=2506422 RepID=A0A4Q1K7F6_9FLAO|nr:two-component regulator propeller domain-containing protein [Flavobacterium amnicola]RXR21194.1 hypothetical protein EQG63_04450 [Flavobacterium amnicola]